MSDYNLFKRLLEKELGVPIESEYKFHPKRKWRADFAILSANLLIEVEGGAYSNGRHTRGSGFIADIEKYNAALLAGFRVYRVVPADLYKEKTLTQLKFLIGNYP